jgi:short-chain fatty acids transporter
MSTQPAPDTENAPLARAGVALADFCQRWFPDAFVFALAAVLFVFVFGLSIGESPLKLVEEFGGGFWQLVPFTMQMALVIIGGFVVASSPPVARIVEWLASPPRGPRGTVAFVAFFAMATSLLSWGFSLIFTGLLVRAIVRRHDDVDFRALSAAAYLGLGSVWALGLSSSAALLQATRSAIPASLLPTTGVIPLKQTIFLPQNLALAAILIVVSVLVAYYSAPRGAAIRNAASMNVHFVPNERLRKDATTPAERVENSPVLVLLVVAMLLSFLALQIGRKGAMSALDLNNFNLFFIAAGLLLHWTPRSFLRAVSESVPATAGVLIQFPFYAGIFGMISKSGIEPTLAGFFVSVTTPSTFNPVVSLYSALLGFFIPSGGGKWVLEAPYVMRAANELQMHLGWTVQTYNAAEALPNLVNPFWMLPLMGILNVRAKDLAGYSILQLLFHLPLVLALCWLFSLTLPYQPPMP